MRKERALLAAVILILVLVCPGWVGATMRSYSFSWNTAEDWIKPEGDPLHGYPIVVRIYVGSQQVFAGYDNGIADTPTVTAVSYDDHHATGLRIMAVATAERAKGPRWTASTTYNAGAIVVPEYYSGDIYLQTADGGTSSTINPFGHAGTDGQVLTDGTISWTVHKAKPLLKVYGGTAYAVGDRIAPPETLSYPPYIVMECITAGITQSYVTPIFTGMVVPNHPRTKWDNRWTGNTYPTKTFGTSVWQAKDTRGEWALGSLVSGFSQRVILSTTDGKERGKRWN